MVEILVRKNKSDLFAYLLFNILVTSFSCLLGVVNPADLSLQDVSPEVGDLLTDDQLKKSHQNLEKIREEKIKKKKELAQAKEKLYQLQQQNKIRKKKRMKEERKREEEERKEKEKRRIRNQNRKLKQEKERKIREDRRKLKEEEDRKVKKKSRQIKGQKENKKEEIGVRKEKRNIEKNIVIETVKSDKIGPKNRIGKEIYIRQLVSERQKLKRDINKKNESREVGNKSNKETRNRTSVVSGQVIREGRGPKSPPVSFFNGKFLIYSMITFCFIGVIVGLIAFCLGNDDRGKNGKKENVK